jgi:hypothetical protein
MAGDFAREKLKSIRLSAKISNSFCQIFQKLTENSSGNPVFQEFSPFFYQKIE